MKNLQVENNDAFRILKFPRWTSESHMFVTKNVPTLYDVLWNFIYKFICQLIDLQNLIIEALTEPSLSDSSYFSCYCKYWNVLILKYSC